MKPIQVAATCLAFMVNATWAQCATGVNTGGGNCVPPDAEGVQGYDGYSNSKPREPTPVWADSWGAIAIDDQKGDAGTINNRATKSQAETEAMRDCSGQGASDCKLALTYHNQCAAIAWGDSTRVVAGNPEEQGAKEDAMSRCQKRTTGCKVVYSACSVARRIQ